ncbi:lsg1 [Ecytonucleospora hepatopenaei]|uniref:Lsg1 n=1 Tax=Ecytonucleospora hepatopenaei TaxID=646526 RepID=A0A1W0E6L6_9MICR|nr:lsg1 [Ecytonucleospora hepatopenaei]
MKKSQKENTKFASFLYSDRFGVKRCAKKKVCRNSILEYHGLSNLKEKLEIENKKISNTKNGTSTNCCIEKYADLLNSLNYSLSIPPRVSSTTIEKEEYGVVEMAAFNFWKYLNKDRVFERNIEIWRQFWLVCEKSDTICQIVDSRRIKYYYNKDIHILYPNKKHVLFVNKCDLSSIKADNPANILSYYYSTKEGEFDFTLKGKIGFVGYPNVGKSSTINLIMKSKKVKVSNTPGKTKYLQTIKGPDFEIYDCPGLVFPKHEKVDLILMGVINVDHCVDLGKYTEQILDFIGIENIRKYYNINEMYNQNTVLEYLSRIYKINHTKCIQKIVKDFFSNKF